MSQRADAVELARFLAFDRRSVDEIAVRLQEGFGMEEGEAKRLALEASTPEPPPPPVPGTGADPLIYY
jgi:hypothetical protein